MFGLGFVSAGYRYQVGDVGPGGGIIYMLPTTSITTPPPGSTTLSNTTDLYYECAPQTWDGGSYDPVYTFGCYQTSGPPPCPTSNPAIGYGLYDSQCYYSACASRPIAVSKALDLTLNTYSDWFLPSAEELKMLQWQVIDYGNIFEVILYGPPQPPGTSGNYWSSTDYSSFQAGNMLMTDYTYANYGYSDKYALYSVKPVRSFEARYL